MSSDVDLNGIHKAYILNNIDEYGRERLFVRVLGVHDISDNFSDKKYGIWIEHCSPSIYRTGDIPQIGDEVYMMFFNSGILPEKLDINKGIWLGIVLKNNFTR